LATNNKNFVVKNGLIVGDSTNLVNYSSSSPSDPFIGQLWIQSDLDVSETSGGSTASGTSLNIPNTLVARSASGTFAIGAIDFDTTASSALSVGRMQWNQNFGTPEVGLIGGNVTANIGQHVHAYVTNDEGSSLVAGDVVYLFGAAGDRASVKKAYNLSDATSSKTFGVVAETIAAGQTGFVTVFGVVNKLDLSSYNPGDVLWLSASPGKFTSIKPSSPQHLVFVGVVEKTNAGNGQLFVNVQNGYELEELHSVQITNLTDNDILSYNGSSSLWFNQNLSTAIQEVDGAGSGIDADLLDGQHESYFLNTSSTTQEKTGDITFHGTLTVNELIVSGSSTFIATQDLSVTDSLIFLSAEQYNSDGLDIGFIGSYGDGTTSSAAHYHASFVRDASQNKWKLLSNGPAPVNNVIDYSHPSVEFGDLQVRSLEVSSSIVVNNFNSDLLDGEHGSYYLDWTNTTNKPDITIGIELSGNTTGAASVTLTDISNGQISIITNTAHATTASFINLSGITGLGSNVSTFLATPTAANLASVVTDETGSGSLVFSNTSKLIRPTLQSPKEITTISQTAATGSVNYDIISQTVLYYTSSAIANWHLNLRGNSSTTLSSLMDVGDAITLVFEVTQGATAYYQLNTMIDGTAITPKWQGGSAPTGGNTSGIDVYSFTVIKTAATPTYTILGTLTGFA
jgi:hypothetical protein